MEIPCDTTIAAAVADYLDAGDFTTSSRTTYRRVLEGMAQALGPALGHRRVRPDTTRALSRADVERILAAPTPLREKTLWRLLYESAARAGEVLALDVEDLDLANRRGRVIGKGGQVEWVTWSTGTATLLSRLLKGRRAGPVF